MGAYQLVLNISTPNTGQGRQEGMVLKKGKSSLIIKRVDEWLFKKEKKMITYKSRELHKQKDIIKKAEILTNY